MRLVEVDDLGRSDVWQELWHADVYQYPRYLPAELQAARAHASGSRFESAGVVAADGEGPVMGLPLTVEHNPSEVRLSCYGRPLYVPTAAGADGARRKAAATLLAGHLTGVARRTRACGLRVRDFLADGHLGRLSELLLRDGARARAHYCQEIDLELPEDRLRKELRRSLRHMLNNPRPDLRLYCVEGKDAAAPHRDALHRLHARLRGRELRTHEGWQRVLDCVTGGHGFFVFGEIAGDIVAGAYFARSKRYCSYALAGHDPAQYGSGLSHLIVWRGIQHARTHGCRWFEVGERLYPAEHADQPDKLHTISNFKAAFGSRVTVRLDIVRRYD